jgi:CBS domain containing-hemolysin-like protein
MEAAILSVTPSQLADLRQKSPRVGEVVAALKREIDKPLAVILILNTAAHTIGAAIAGASFQSLFAGAYMGLFSLAFTLIMVQYTELLPKTLGVRFNTRILLVTARPLSIAAILFSPLIKLTKWFNRPFERRAP